MSWGLDIGKKPEIILMTLIVGSIIGASLGYLVGKYELRKIIPFHDKEKEKQMQMYFRKLRCSISSGIPVDSFCG